VGRKLAVRLRRGAHNKYSVSRQIGGEKNRLLEYSLQKTEGKAWSKKKAGKPKMKGKTEETNLSKE